VGTEGCQMNVHDCERIAGLPDEAGYAPVADGAQPDDVVFETCAVRENADNKLYGNLGHLTPGQGPHGRQAESPSASAWLRGTRRRSSSASPTSTSSSAPTTSGRCLCCSSAPASSRRRRSSCNVYGRPAGLGGQRAVVDRVS
jgi:hypothetical protein